MPDLADLLDRTTPRGLVAPDLTEIARRADQRRRRRRRAPVVAGVAVVAVLATVAGTVAIGGDDRPEDLAVAANPWGGTDLLTAPVGEWRRAADPPFSARQPSLTGPLSDGRVLVWGGFHTEEGEPLATPLLDGAIYDPLADAWEPIAPAPLTDDLVIHMVSVARDRLLVVGGTPGNGPRFIVGAVYDVATRTWTVLPPLPDARGLAAHVDAGGWTGDVLALVQVRHGTAPTSSEDIDSRIDAPITRRWVFGSDAWADGASPPLGLRHLAAVAFDGNRLAVVGGTGVDLDAAGVPPGPETAPALANDGAVYDVVADAWTPIPSRADDAVINARATWLDDRRLLMSGGAEAFSSDNDQPTGVALAYDMATGAWDPFPPSDRVISSAMWQFHVAGVPVVVSEMSATEDAPYGDLRVVGPVIVATSADALDPDIDSFAVEVRTGPEVWLEAAEAPFGTRTRAGIAPVGDDSLLVVGGSEQLFLDGVDDAWILDLNP